MSLVDEKYKTTMKVHELNAVTNLTYSTKYQTDLIVFKGWSFNRIFYALFP